MTKACRGAAAMMRSVHTCQLRVLLRGQYGCLAARVAKSCPGRGWQTRLVTSIPEEDATLRRVVPSILVVPLLVAAVLVGGVGCGGGKGAVASVSTLPTASTTTEAPTTTTTEALTTTTLDPKARVKEMAVPITWDELLAGYSGNDIRKVSGTIGDDGLGTEGGVIYIDGDASHMLPFVILKPWPSEIPFPSPALADFPPGEVTLYGMPNQEAGVESDGKGLALPFTVAIVESE